MFSLSCSAGNCAAGGEVLLEPRTGPVEAFVVDETAGTWGDAEEVPGITTLGPEGRPAPRRSPAPPPATAWQSDRTETARATARHSL